MLKNQYVPRSILYTPAVKPDHFIKSKISGADVGVIDLEDGVSDDKKDFARENVRLFYKQQPGWRNAIRINPIKTSNGLKDLILIKELAYKPDIIIQSMVETAEEITITRNILSDKDYQPLIYVTVETPQCIKNIYKIAQACDGLIFGSADFSAALGINVGGWKNVLFARSQIIVAAAYANIPAFDTAFFDIKEDQGLVDECNDAIELGFSGKTAVHPCQIATINKIFTPQEKIVVRAREIINAANSASENISKINQQMIGPPFVKLANKILQRYQEIENEGVRHGKNDLCS